MIASLFDEKVKQNGQAATGELLEMLKEPLENLKPAFDEGSVVDDLLNWMEEHLSGENL